MSCQGSEPHAQHPQTTPATPSAQTEARLRKRPPVSGLPLPKKWAELEPPSLPGSATHTPSKPTCQATLGACPLPTAQPGMPTQSSPVSATTLQVSEAKGLRGTTAFLLYEHRLNTPAQNKRCWAPASHSHTCTPLVPVSNSTFLGLGFCGSPVRAPPPPPPPLLCFRTLGTLPVLPSATVPSAQAAPGAAGAGEGRWTLVPATEHCCVSRAAHGPL